MKTAFIVAVYLFPVTQVALAYFLVKWSKKDAVID